MINNRSSVSQLRLVCQQVNMPSESGYVQRLRLQRVVLKLHRSIAKEHELDLPTSLRQGIPLGNNSEVCRLSNDLAARVAKICQPSESLDHHWVVEWNGMLLSLGQLEAAYSTMNSREEDCVID